MAEEHDRAHVLRSQIQDHLFEQGFMDDLMYVHIFLGFDGHVLISLAPYAYNCEVCEAKGFTPKLADAFRQRISPTWCENCAAVTDRRWKRTGDLTPRLREVLEQAFTVVEVTPDNPFTSFMVSAPGSVPPQRPGSVEAGKRKGAK